MDGLSDMEVIVVIVVFDVIVTSLHVFSCSRRDRWRLNI